MMTIDQILTKLDHYYKEDQLTEVEPFLLSCLEDAKKEQGRCKMDGMIQLQLLHQKKNILPDRKCSLKLSDASVKAQKLVADGNINAILLLFFGILQTG